MEQDKLSGGKNLKVLKSRRKLGWTGPKEIEELCAMFTTFLTTPSAKTLDQLTGKVPIDKVDDRPASSKLDSVKEDPLKENKD